MREECPIIHCFLLFHLSTALCSVSFWLATSIWCVCVQMFALVASPPFSPLIWSNPPEMLDRCYVR
ncbi:hypothetical protein BCV70DRAFT_11402 [Testicularia cyperi]|uniref:Uncharacterized protein n=1 Tax=Testicularia cyperi TaxID=1882483 RepID=A0A317XXT0_9BASI|nr:hypothetical protein BCV70DRAFT_11402 [Testicularia cyperi]